jgi:arabinan endo-1,5-alpha-L-arabinosidase
MYNDIMNNIQIASSKDSFTWKYGGDALPQKPKWASHTQHFNSKSNGVLASTAIGVGD